MPLTRDYPTKYLNIYRNEVHDFHTRLIFFVKRIQGTDAHGDLLLNGWSRLGRYTKDPEEKAIIPV